MLETHPSCGRSIFRPARRGEQARLINHALLSRSTWLQSHGLRGVPVLILTPARSPETVCDPVPAPIRMSGTNAVLLRDKRRNPPPAWAGERGVPVLGGNPLPNGFANNGRKRMVQSPSLVRARRGSPAPVVLGLPFIHWHMPRQRFITYVPPPVFFPMTAVNTSPAIFLLQPGKLPAWPSPHIPSSPLSPSFASQPSIGNTVAPVYLGAEPAPVCGRRWAIGRAHQAGRDGRNWWTACPRGGAPSTGLRTPRSHGAVAAGSPSKDGPQTMFGLH